MKMADLALMVLPLAASGAIWALCRYFYAPRTTGVDEAVLLETNLVEDSIFLKGLQGEWMVHSRSAWSRASLAGGYLEIGVVSLELRREGEEAPLLPIELEEGDYHYDFLVDARKGDRLRVIVDEKGMAACYQKLAQQPLPEVADRNAYIKHVLFHCLQFSRL